MAPSPSSQPGCPELPHVKCALFIRPLRSVVNWIYKPAYRRFIPGLLRVYFEDLANPKHYSEPVTGSFLTPTKEKRDLNIVWSGDTAGQGFGINADWGGMKIYRAMNELTPDLFIHSGDYIYADNPIPAEIPLDDGGVWKNLTTPEKAKAAETLAEFRGNYAYNLLDEHVRRFNAAAPQLVQ